MESIQAFLTSAIVIIWYFVSTLIIFDFLYGLPALMEQVAIKEVTSSIQVINQEQSVQETFFKGLSDTSTVTVSNADESTLQYLEMVGADIDDFGTIAQAREFLDVHAPWTIETPPMQSTRFVPNPEVATHTQLEAVQEEKLTYPYVQAEFALLGWDLQKHRCGHFRYQLKINNKTERFKTLQDCLDWLGEQPSITSCGCTLT